MLSLDFADDSDTFLLSVDSGHHSGHHTDYHSGHHADSHSGHHADSGLVFKEDEDLSGPASPITQSSKSSAKLCEICGKMFEGKNRLVFSWKTLVNFYIAFC